MFKEAVFTKPADSVLRPDRAGSEEGGRMDHRKLTVEIRFITEK